MRMTARPSRCSTKQIPRPCRGTRPCRPADEYVLLEAAETGLATGFYAEQVAKFVTFYAAAPGRETYDVAIARAPGDDRARHRRHEPRLRHPGGDAARHRRRRTRGRPARRGRARSAQPGVPPSRRAERRPASGPQRADHRRFDAGHRDHRRRADDGRHDEPDDPLVGNCRTGPHGRDGRGARRRHDARPGLRGRRGPLLPGRVRGAGRPRGRWHRARSLAWRRSSTSRWRSSMRPPARTSRASRCSPAILPGCTGSATSRAAARSSRSRRCDPARST